MPAQFFTDIGFTTASAPVVFFWVLLLVVLPGAAGIAFIVFSVVERFSDLLDFLWKIILSTLMFIVLPLAAVIGFVWSIFKE